MGIPKSEASDPRYISTASVTAQSKCPHRITSTYRNRLECATCGSRRIDGGSWQYLTAAEFHVYTGGIGT